MATSLPDRLPQPLRVVVFGPPRSGKSKLFDAIAAVALTRTDDAVPLVPADATVVPGAVIRRSVTVDLPGPRAATGDVEFIDCDGKAAKQLLADADQLRQARARSELAWSVRSTDALLVVVDATWKPEQVDEAFAQLQSFFRVLRVQRAAERTVGGLPVFLVLGKADELARRGEGFSDWQARVRDELARLETQFRDWFEQSGGPFLSFGSTELHVTATATTWPDVIGGIPDSTGGFGVDDLHNNCLLAARNHQERVRRSRKRLHWTAGVAVGLLGLMLVGLLALSATHPPSAVEALTARIQRAQRAFGPPEVRLSDSRFDRNRQEWKEIREAAAFDQLPEELRHSVDAELHQFEEYERYRARFDVRHPTPHLSPAAVRTGEEFKALETALATTLAPPAEFAQQWESTEAVRLWRKWRGDLERLTDAEREAHAWYTAQHDHLTKLQMPSVPSARWSPAEWRRAVGEAVARQPTHPPDQTIGDSPSVPIPRGEPITWATAYQYGRAAVAAGRWREAAFKLADTRDMADAVGLTDDPKMAEAVFALPVTPDVGQALGLAADRMTKLKERYPRALQEQTGWTATGLPAPLRDALGQRLTVAEKIARELVASDPAAKGGEWAKLATPGGLLTKPEMAEWGKLLRLLRKWTDADHPDEDPVEHLKSFVTRSEFRWPVTKVALRLPNALRVRAAEKAESLVVRVGSGDSPKVYTFTPGTPKVDADVTTVEFTPVADTLVYTPGELLTAAVTLSDPDGRYTLRWQPVGRSEFAFAVLIREPTIETDGPNPVPQRADDVRLTVVTRPGGEEFRVPVLLPQVK